MARHAPSFAIPQVFLSLVCGSGLLSCSSDSLEASRIGVYGAAASAATETPIDAVADTFVKKWDDDGNFGDHTELRVEGEVSSSLQRSLVRFDSEEISSVVGEEFLEKAELELNINHVIGFWGDGVLSVHRMTEPWNEAGATWDCANDTGTLWSDCDLDDRWGMDWYDIYTKPYHDDPTDTVYVAPYQSEAVRFDVTGDVRQFLDDPTTNNGWILRSEMNNYIVRVHFKSRESSEGPSLVLSHTQCGCGVDDCGTIERCDTTYDCDAIRGECLAPESCSPDNLCEPCDRSGGCSEQCPCHSGEGPCSSHGECRFDLYCDGGVCRPDICRNPDHPLFECIDAGGPCPCPSYTPDCADKSCGNDGGFGSCGDQCNEKEAGCNSNLDCAPGPERVNRFETVGI